MGKMTVNTEICKGCGLCTTACPQKIVALDLNVINSKGYNPSSVTDPSKCTGCALCAMMCPDCAITVER
jgi:2-oxoglutarate ferredoxin oxidoreductase subunit delta